MEQMNIPDKVTGVLRCAGLEIALRKPKGSPGNIRAI